MVGWSLSPPVVVVVSNIIIVLTAKGSTGDTEINETGVKLLLPFIIIVVFLPQGVLGELRSRGEIQIGHHQNANGSDGGSSSCSRLLLLVVVLLLLLLFSRLLRLKGGNERG